MKRYAKLSLDSTCGIDIILYYKLDNVYLHLVFWDNVYRATNPISPTQGKIHRSTWMTTTTILTSKMTKGGP